MSTAKTTADLFRERGWGPGTLVKHDTWLWHAVVLAFSSCGQVAVENPRGIVSGVESNVLTGWSIYRPTPPVPTEEEWRELWAKLEAFASLWVDTQPLGPVNRELVGAVNTLKAKVQP